MEFISPFSHSSPFLLILAGTISHHYSFNTSSSSSIISSFCSFSHFEFLLLVAFLPATISSLGINYGQIGNNLPSPEKVVPLVTSLGATKVKLYDANPVILKAFANSGIEFMICIPNEILSKVKDPKQARDWVKRNVQAHLPATNITAIVVGNEILTYNDTVLSQSLLPAMQSVHTSLVSLELDKQVAVTTTHSLSVLETSYPPSSGEFRSDLADCLTQILDFNLKVGSPFLINAYPFFAYKANPKQISLDFVLFEGDQDQGVVDPNSGLHYDNMLFAQIDAVYTALASLGFRKVPVHISETGWPSKGDNDEFGATPENARRYNGNLMKLMEEGKGTPMRPDSDLSIFLFALFDEDMKPGPASERNYGLFKADGTPAYSLGFAGVQALRNSTGSGGVSDGGEGRREGPPAPEMPSSSGYLSISAATVRDRWTGIVFIAFWMGLLVLLA